MCYKKKWGVKVENDSSAGFFIKTLRASSGVDSFLQHNPYIVVSKEGNSAVFFSRQEESAQDTIDNNIRNNYLPGGLDWIVVCSLMGDASIRQIFKTPVRIT
jgi:hypothetical protein